MSTIIRCDRPTCKKVDDIAGDRLTTWTDDWCVQQIDLCRKCSLELKVVMDRWWTERNVST